MALYLEALKPLGWRQFENYDSSTGPDHVPDLYGLGDHPYGRPQRDRLDTPQGVGR